MTQLVRFDTAALNRALVGFDTMFNDLEDRWANQVGNNNYPPYNIVKYTDDQYEIQLAVTGFEPAEISVEIDQNQLIVKGRSASAVPTQKPATMSTAEWMDTVEQYTASEPTYLHRGLASRDFSRAFTLAEHMEVGTGSIRNGVLKIKLTRLVPEVLKPRVLKITAE